MSTSLDWGLYLWHLYSVCLVTYIPLRQCPELTFAVYFTAKVILFPAAYVALQYLAVLPDLISFHLPLLRGLQTLWPSSSSLYTPKGHFFHPASPCGVGRMFIPGLGKLLSYILIFGSQIMCVLLRVTFWFYNPSCPTPTIWFSHSIPHFHFVALSPCVYKFY